VIGGLHENGFSKVVEIDESKFFHRKYHRGQLGPMERRALGIWWNRKGIRNQTEQQILCLQLLEGAIQKKCFASFFACIFKRRTFLFCFIYFYRIPIEFFLFIYKIINVLNYNKSLDLYYLGRLLSRMVGALITT
jgi:hypothetical protein